MLEGTRRADLQFVKSGSIFSVYNQSGDRIGIYPNIDVNSTIALVIAHINKACTSMGETAFILYRHDTWGGLFKEYRAMRLNMGKWIYLSHEQRVMVILAQDFII